MTAWYWLTAEEGKLTSTTPCEMQLMFMSFSFRISPKCPNTPEIEHKVLSHICVVTSFRLLFFTGLLESSMRLKPHEAQSYRKKALWVSWVSIAVTIILAIVAFSECFLSWVFCLTGSGTFYISEEEMKKTVQRGSAACCFGLQLKDRFVNYCGRLLIWVTPNSLIKQRPAWGTGSECVQDVYWAQIRSDPPAAWFYFPVWMFKSSNVSSWFHFVESGLQTVSTFHSQVENLFCNQVRLFPVACKVQRRVWSQ